MRFDQHLVKKSSRDKRKNPREEKDINAKVRYILQRHNTIRISLQMSPQIPLDPSDQGPDVAHAGISDNNIDVPCRRASASTASKGSCQARVSTLTTNSREPSAVGSPERVWEVGWSGLPVRGDDGVVGLR